ncbi:elongator complex protein 2 [Elysia marginata]|uniref:Elongator complex protein 2 n=1 Tax=Elysia marginata TaxID=1093978 RepID=A0AAV4HJS4_9GAST|nr:elongator complex protein 2 [Elysia marginata]
MMTGTAQLIQNGPTGCKPHLSIARCVQQAGITVNTDNSTPVQTHTSSVPGYTLVPALSWSGRDETEFVSGSSDCTVIVWHTNDNQIVPSPLCTLRGHTGSVTCVSALNVPCDNKNAGEQKKEALLFSASIDSTVRVWSKSGSESREVQVFSFGEGFALTIASCIIPQHKIPVFACGCDDHSIHLYVQADDGKFIKLSTLSGHEDWVRGLHFTTDENEDILLASCAQDHFIRVWRLAQKIDSDSTIRPRKAVADMSLDEDITVKEKLITFDTKGKSVCFAVYLESVLSGHENWVYSVRWKPKMNGSTNHSLKLLSASMDKTMILWSPDPESGIWTEEVRVGDVGGNTLGLFGGLFSPCGQSILGHGYQGAFNQWTYDDASGVWLPEVTGGGHFAPVADLTWSKDGGDYILTTSVDQTTRLHAPWMHGDNEFTWCEVARPQVHGYDLKCLAGLGKYSFASGADEKLVRVFQAPKNFINNFCQICGHDVNKEINKEDCKSLPEGANVPALGLSNKAVFTSDIDSHKDKEKEDDVRPGQYPENYFTPSELKAPPSEDLLLQNTLWPEEGKLYGHGYEIFSLAAHPNGKILASACKAAKADAANILLWDMETKKIISSLKGCALTVTQMAFSHEGNRLLAVSRDRTWVLYRESAPGQYSIEASVNKKTSSHSRIIWSCAWTHDDKYFLTASRDKTVCVWSIDKVTQPDHELSTKPSSCLTLSDSVTAVATAPGALKDERYLIAIGLDNGQISIHIWSPHTANDTWTTLISLNQSEAHHQTVTRLAFRPQLGRLGHKQEKDYIQLASSGSDHAVRVYDLCIRDFL